MNPFIYWNANITCEIYNNTCEIATVVCYIARKILANHPLSFGLLFFRHGGVCSRGGRRRPLVTSLLSIPIRNKQ